jgi:hypothetical protein
VKFLHRLAHDSMPFLPTLGQQWVIGDILRQGMCEP